MNCHQVPNNVPPDQLMLDALKSIPIVEGAVPTLPWLLVLIFSLIGSSHCLAMCGPQVHMVVSTSKSRTKDLIFFNVFRLASYLLAVSLFYTLNIQLNDLFNMSMPIIFTLLGGISILIWILTKKKAKGSCQRRCTGCSSRKNMFSLLGLLSGLLPCITLTPVLLYATTFSSLLEATGIMFTFWIGTLPVMLLASSTLANNFRKIPDELFSKIQLGVSCVIVFFGIYSYF